MERSLQGAVTARVEAALGEDGHKVLAGCPGCGSADRRDFRKNGTYKRNLVATEGRVEVVVQQLRCRCGKSQPVEHLGFGRRQRYSYEFQLAVVEMAICLKGSVTGEGGVAS